MKTPGHKNKVCDAFAPSRVLLETLVFLALARLLAGYINLYSSPEEFLASTSKDDLRFLTGDAHT